MQPLVKDNTELDDTLLSSIKKEKDKKLVRYNNEIEITDTYAVIWLYLPWESYGKKVILRKDINGQVYLSYSNMTTDHFLDFAKNILYGKKAKLDMRDLWEYKPNKFGGVLKLHHHRRSKYRFTKKYYVNELSFYKLAMKLDSLGRQLKPSKITWFEKFGYWSHSYFEYDTITKKPDAAWW